MLKIDNFQKVFNARHLAPEQVAERFIYNPDFEELLLGNHTVLLGPRGCGKTTLMKMLTLPALNVWKDRRANKIKEGIDFFAVYISTDIYWQVQKDSYYEQLKDFPDYADVISKVAVTTSVLHALTITMAQVCEYNYVSNNAELESKMCQYLIQRWGIPATIPTYSMVQQALIERSGDLNRHIQSTMFNCRSEEDVRNSYEDYFSLDYHSSVIEATSFFVKLYDCEDRYKWALCFDELELAPLWLQDKLFQGLRSTAQNILFKLSASPIVSISSDILATAGNDLKLVKMWPNTLGNKYRDFSEKLVKAILKEKFGKSIDPEDVFGTNPLLHSGKHTKTYEEGGETWKEIKLLATTDSNLKKLLLSSGINPNNPVEPKGNNKAGDTILRKIKPIVYFRNYYSQYNSKKDVRTKRSRKAQTLFYGKELIYTICDGNPRWLIGIVNGMLKQIGEESVKISPSNQAQVLERISQQFHNIIKSMPGNEVVINGKPVTLSDILDKIGTRINQDIVLGPFKKDPASTFVIDKELDDDVIEILKQAAYQGAIILMNPEKESFDFKMEGKTFRLSYMLCPFYKIPLRKYSKRSFINYFEEKKTDKEIGIPTNKIQGTFDYE